MRVLQPAHLEPYSFERLPYYLHPNTKEQLQLFRYICAPR
jgi:hypothetical protein